MWTIERKNRVYYKSVENGVKAMSKLVYHYKKEVWNAMPVT